MSLAMNQAEREQSIHGVFAADYLQDTHKNQRSDLTQTTDFDSKYCGCPNSSPAKLKSLGIIVGSGLQCSPLAHQTLGTEREGLARISVGMDQNARDIEVAIETISKQIAI